MPKVVAGVERDEEAVALVDDSRQHRRWKDGARPPGGLHLARGVRERVVQEPLVMEALLGSITCRGSSRTTSGVMAVERGSRAPTMASQRAAE